MCLELGLCSSGPCGVCLGCCTSIYDRIVLWRWQSKAAEMLLLPDLAGHVPCIPPILCTSPPPAAFSSLLRTLIRFWDCQLPWHTLLVCGWLQRSARRTVTADGQHDNASPGLRQGRICWAADWLTTQWGLPACGALVTVACMAWVRRHACCQAWGPSVCDIPVC